MDAGQLVEHAGERGRHRRVRVDDRTGVVAAVDAEMEVDLGGRDEVPGQHAALEVDDANVGRVEARKLGARGRDRYAPAHTCADVPGRPEHEPIRRQAARCDGNLLSLRIEHPAAAYRRRPGRHSGYFRP